MKKVLDLCRLICYNNNCQGADESTNKIKRVEKVLKKTQKPLDKRRQVCYNIIVPREQKKLRVMTDIRKGLIL